MLVAFPNYWSVSTSYYLSAGPWTIIFPFTPTTLGKSILFPMEFVDEENVSQGRVMLRYTSLKGIGFSGSMRPSVGFRYWRDRVLVLSQCSNVTSQRGGSHHHLLITGTCCCSCLRHFTQRGKMPLSKKLQTKMFVDADLGKYCFGFRAD